MATNQFLDINPNDYQKILAIVAKKLSIINKSSYELELKELRNINHNDVYKCIQLNKIRLIQNNLQVYSDKIRIRKNKEIDDSINYLLDFNNYTNGNNEDKEFYINEWMKILNASRTTYSIALMHKIKTLRIEKGYTQQNIANLLDITYQAYAHYEKGRRQPDINTLVKLSKIFGVTIEYLLDLQPQKVIDSYGALKDVPQIQKEKVSNEAYFFMQKLYKCDIRDDELSKLSIKHIKIIASTIKNIID